MRLELTHANRTITIERGELLFGRTAELVVGAGNQFVHRTMGRFVHQNSCWWVENRATHLPITVTSYDGTRVELATRSTTGNFPLTAVVAERFTVRFSAGGVTYEIDGELAAPRPIPTAAAARRPPGEDTIRAIRLTPEERQLVAALARPVLIDPGAGPDALPANRAVARELGWPDTKLNRKLDYLCHRLTKQGFQGLKGELGGEAKLRRWRLVEYAVSHGLVTLADLEVSP